MTIVKALQGLYVDTGGTLDDRYSFIASNAPVGDYKRAVDCLKAVYMLIGGSEEDISALSSISSLVYEIGKKGIVVPEGTLEISANGDYDVTEYAQAKVQTPVPTGTVEITANGTGIDVAQYATADVAVPQPTGKITITANGTDIDIAQYATADVAVPTHEEDYIDLIEGDVVHFDVPNGTTKIKEYLFENDTTLEEVTIPNTLLQIGQSAFMKCSNLHTINIDEALTTIGNSAFSYSGLTSINIHSGVRLGTYLCERCTSLVSCELHSAPLSYSFQYCSALTSAIIDYTAETEADRSLPISCFAYCRSLNNVTLVSGNKLSIVDAYCFDDCTSLETITLPASVYKININAFRGCTSLTTVYLLGTFTSPSSSISGAAFTNCSALTDIYFGGTQAQWTSFNVTIPAGCTVHYEYTPT